MSVVVVGLNHRTVPLAVLESVTVLPGRMPKALHDLAGREHLGEVAVLSTCMRTEVYAVTSRFHGAMNDLRNFLAEWSGTPPESFSDHLYSFWDEAAAHHLFQVAAGLDSAVLGEGEILRQVRSAWSAARDERAAGSVLGLLFRQALEAGKRVRAETAIARGTTSLSQAAVAMAADRLGTLEGATTLLAGAGEIGQAVVQALGQLEGTGPVLVANRTRAKATALARRWGGEVVSWAGLPAALERADVLVTSTGSPGVVLDAEDVAPALLRRPERPLLVVDLAVPRDVDTHVGALRGVTLLDMDDLKRFAEQSMADRRQELPRAQAIVAEEVGRYRRLALERQAAPVVAALHEHAEQVRAAELERFASKLVGLDERQAEAVAALTRGIVAKLLHEPTVNLKAASGTPAAVQLASALRQLFEL